VIRVLVSDDNCIDRLRSDARNRKALLQNPRREAGVDEDA
jgi:hypothetical protein